MSETEAPIFISYRRDPDQQAAGRLKGILSEHFEGEVFMDIDSIDPGVDFQRKLETALARCEVFLAVIGKDWSQARNSKGQRRLDDPSDFVRLEIATALARDKVRVIPLLVDGATMPGKEELPPDLQALASRNAAELRHTRFDADVQFLIQSMEARLRTNWQQNFGFGLFAISLLGYLLATLFPSYADSSRYRWPGLALALVLPPAVAMSWVSLRSRRLPTLRTVYTRGLLSYARIPATILVLGIGFLVSFEAKRVHAKQQEELRIAEDRARAERVAYVVVLPIDNDLLLEIADPKSGRIHLGSAALDSLEELPPIGGIDWSEEKGVRPYLFVSASAAEEGSTPLPQPLAMVSVSVVRASIESYLQEQGLGKDGLDALLELDPPTSIVDFGSVTRFSAWFQKGDRIVPLDLVIPVLHKDLAP